MNDRNWRRGKWTLVVAFVVLTAWMGTIGSPVRHFSVDGYAQTYVDAGLKRALATFATARALNAVLSIAQSADVSVQPFGVGVEVGVGQLLRPINDVVGQFAELMLTAVLVFAGMDVLLRVGGHWIVAVALSVVGALLVYGQLMGRSASLPIIRTFVALSVLRFAIPLVFVANEGIYQTFMADEYTAHQHAIQISSEQIENEAGIPSGPVDAAKGKPPSSGWFDRLFPKESSEARLPQKEGPGMVESLKEWVAQKGDLSERLNKLLRSAEQTTVHVIRLMVVFLLQTLVIPLLLGWALLRGLGAASRVFDR